MTPEALETVYEALARQLDALPESQRELYLAKLALLFAQALGEAPRARALIAEAAENLAL